MKTTLKDFPTGLYGPIKGKDLVTQKAELLNITASTWKWFIDFRKEIKAQIKEAKNWGQPYQNTRIEALKEILGE